MEKKLLFSVTSKDFEVQTFRAGGKGGQNQNKVNSGVRIIHKASGARGEARDSRDQPRNKQAAFRRLLETKEWKVWHRLECAKRTGSAKAAEKAVEETLSNPKNIKIEVLTENGWVASTL